LAALIFTAMMIVFACTTSWYTHNCRALLQKSDSHSDLISYNAKPVVVAISIISQMFIAFTFTVSVYASLQFKHQPADFRSSSSPFISNVSIMVAAGDGILLLVCFLTDAVALYVAIFSSCPLDCMFIILSCNGFYALLTILLHSPYIILAYINDASLTGGMSIFYVITVSSQLIALTRFFKVYQEYSIPLCHKRCFLKCFNNKHQNDAILESRNVQEQPTERIPLLTCAKTTRVQKCDMFCSSLLFIVYSVIFCALIMVVAALLILYLVMLPITNGFSNLFNRLFITFHIAIAIVGALIYAAYKIFIEKKSDSHSEKEEEKSIERKEKDM
jgi:hypothetical protein